MKSHNAMADAIAHDAAAMAEEMGLKPVTVRKWKESPEQSGSVNPLERVATVIRTALSLGRPRYKALRPLYWLAAQFSMIVFPAPERGVDLAGATNRLAHLMREFGEFVSAVAGTLEHGSLTAEEYTTIRAKGAELMQALAQFLRLLGTGQSNHH